MAILRRNLTTAPAAKWTLAYDQGRRKLFVEILSKGVVKSYGVDAAMKMEGSDDLRLTIIDMFKAGR